MSHYSGFDVIKSSFDKPDIWSAEIISLSPSTVEIKSAEISSVNSVAKSQKFIPAEITRYTVIHYRNSYMNEYQIILMFIVAEITGNTNTTIVNLIWPNWWKWVAIDEL